MNMNMDTMKQNTFNEYKIQVSLYIADVPQHEIKQLLKLT